MVSKRISKRHENRDRKGKAIEKDNEKRIGSSDLGTKRRKRLPRWEHVGESILEPIKGGDEESNVVDSIEFEKGKNKIRISLIKKHNRMYRIQIFLNDGIEIRPVTYTGSSMAKAYWSLLLKEMKD